MKKLLSILLALIITMSAFMGLGFSVSAEDADVLSLTVNGVKTEIPVGDSFTYTYALTDLEIMCMEASVAYDSTYLELTKVSEDDDAYDAFLEEVFPKVCDSAVINLDLEDEILYNFTRNKTYSFRGEEAVAVFEFKVLAAGESTITTNVIELGGKDREYYVDKTPIGSVKVKDYTYAEYITYVAPEEPTEEPTDAPTDAPTEEPTEEPTQAPTHPIKVENIVATPASSTAVLTWDAVEGATKYWIYKNIDGSFIGYTSSNTTSATMINLKGNTTYQFKVVATFSDGIMQKLSDATVVEFTTEAPVVIDGLVATPDVTSVHLSWNAREEAQKYWIYKAYNENGPFYVYDVTTDLEYTVKRLQPDTTYYFKIVPSVLSNGWLSLGEEDSAQKLEATTTSGEVITTVVTNVTSTTATISWPKFENAVKYWVLYSTTTKSTSDLSNWTTFADTTDTTYTFKWREPGEYYFFTVVALYNDAETGRQETVNYVASGARMPYSDGEFITFTPVDEDTVTLSWPEDTGATKVWVSYIDESGKEIMVKSTLTNDVTLDLAGYENYRYTLISLDSAGKVGYLTPMGGEKYHN